MSYFILSSKRKQNTFAGVISKTRAWLGQ